MKSTLISTMLSAVVVFAFGMAFADLNTDQQTDLLTAEMELAAGAAGGSEQPFFAMLRELVVLGYFTSETGASQALHYLPMPGSYDGAYPLEQVETNWSS